MRLDEFPWAYRRHFLVALWAHQFGQEDTASHELWVIKPNGMTGKLQKIIKPHPNCRKPHKSMSVWTPPVRRGRLCPYAIGVCVIISRKIPLGPLVWKSSSGCVLSTHVINNQSSHLRFNFCYLFLS